MNRRSAPKKLPSWRQQAIRRMTRSRESTLKFLAHLSESKILQPRTQGKWSIKDVLAHIAAWEEEAVRRLDLILRGRGDQIVFYDDIKEVDRFNARAVTRARKTSLPALLKRLARVRERLIERFLQLPLEALNDPSHRYPVKIWLPEFAWTHEREHLRRIREWWTASARKTAAGRRGT
ncbi:MAG: DinB family protein [bacterium]